MGPHGKKKQEEVSFYGLSNLVIAMAHKEINEKPNGSDPHFAVLGKPSHKSVGLGTNKDKNNPSANVTHANMKETKCEESPPSQNFYKEIKKSSNRNELFQNRSVGQQEKEKCHQKHFVQDKFANNLSKEIPIYANNVVSVMVVSVMKTVEGQANGSIKCIVLKRLLKHSKTVVSDIIDSCMKNLHDIAGKLLTNSDFASSAKPTLFTLGSCKAAEIIQATLNHFHSTLRVQKAGGDSLTYASVKTGSRTDAKAQMRSAATRTETLPKEKEITCADAVGNHIIKQVFTLWHENQNQCSQCSKSQPRRELKQDHQRTCPGVEVQPGNPTIHETNQNTGKNTGHIGLSDMEQSCEEAVSGLTKMLTGQLDLSREDSSSAQFIGSLVDTVQKLCLVIVKYSNPESLLAESGSREDHFIYVTELLWFLSIQKIQNPELLFAFLSTWTMKGNLTCVWSLLPFINDQADSSSSPLVISPFGSLLRNPAMENLQKLPSVAVEEGYKVEVLQAMVKYKK
ncbi:LOW QUALITY PROTEIN: A-kinase anchor protein 3 [Leptosomus discolor]